MTWPRSPLRSIFAPSLQWRAVALRFPMEAKQLRFYRIFQEAASYLTALICIALVATFFFSAFFILLRISGLSKSTLCGWFLSLFYCSVCSSMALYAALLAAWALSRILFPLDCKAVKELLRPYFGDVGSAGYTPTPALLDAMSQVKAQDEARQIDGVTREGVKAPSPRGRSL